MHFNYTLGKYEIYLQKIAIFDPKNLKFGPMPRYPYDFCRLDRAQGATF